MNVIVSDVLMYCYVVIFISYSLLYRCGLVADMPSFLKLTLRVCVVIESELV